MEKETRRRFIKTGAAGIVAGAAAGVGLPFLNARPAKAAPVHPFGYPVGGLDVEAVRQLGYLAYKGVQLGGVAHKHCGFATFHTIVDQLAGWVGYPYDAIPTQMMEWASGGVAGFGTFCGALNGACAAIGLVCVNSDAVGFVSDLLSWYADTPLPTNIVAPTGPLSQSVAGANLCHVSVTNWCLASGFASGSPERSERCARLAGDVAAQAVSMLNSGHPGLTIPGDKTDCRMCHYKGTDFNGGQFTRGKMDCETCHVDMERVEGDEHPFKMASSHDEDREHRREHEHEHHEDDDD